MSLKIAIAVAIPIFWLAVLFHCAWGSSPKSTKQDVIKYRNDERSLFRSSQTHFTGYTTAFQDNRDRNDRKSPMYQLPRELVIQVMEYLSPEDLYLARQASSLLFSLFQYATFKRFHQIPPIQGWNPVYVWGVPPEGQGRDWAFKTCIFTRRKKKWLGNNEKKNYIARRLRNDRMCRRCANRVKPAQSRPHDRLLCVYCYCYHSISCFSDGQTGRDNRVCLAWEGKQKICPHRHISLFEPLHFHTDIKNNPAVNLFECAECKSTLGMKKHEEPPSLKTKVSVANIEGSEGTLEHSWKATIATLAKDQVVTKELLLENLKRLDSILCPHTRSGANPRILLDPFQRYHCVCFRGPTLEEPLCHAGHSRDTPVINACCACHTTSYESVGKFMAPNKFSKHEVCCSACSAGYRWSLEGNRIMLRMRRTCSNTQLVRIAQDNYAVKLTYGTCNMGKYISSLDPETYHGNKYTPRANRCDDVACRDYRLAMGRDYSFMFHW